MNFLQRIKWKLEQLNKIPVQLLQIQDKLHKIQEALGRIETRQLQISEYQKFTITDNQFRVFSQWGEDGIIQFLLKHIPINYKIFIEFGVQDYTESNTRFLLINNNWTGLIIDSDINQINCIKKESIYWRYNLNAIQAFITKDNINNLILQNGIKGEIGLLSIDIDGNDYWVWQAIEVVNPAIVIIEYNFRFGIDKAVTVPYDEKFIRSQAHYSSIYFGASLKAVCFLAQKKGYAFVGCNSAGNNAFFVRLDLKPEYLKELTVEEGYVAGKFRECRDIQGNLSYLSLDEEEKILALLPLVEIK